eukprot:scaffold214530_cov50-Attheya_sp.AAC.1
MLCRSSSTCYIVQDSVARYRIWQVLLAIVAVIFGVCSLQGNIGPQIGDFSVRTISPSSTTTKEPHKVAIREEDSSLPLLVLHIGAPKTATTTIQCYAAGHQSRMATDNVYFLGWLGTNRDKLPCIEDGSEVDFNVMWPDCLYRCQCEDTLWNQFESVLEKHRKLNHTVVYSYEIMYYVKDDCDDFWDRLDQLVKGKWNVRIAFSYRRYYDWLISEYHQGNNAASKKLRHWPDGTNNNDKVLQSFPEFFRNDLDKCAKRGPASVTRRWKARYPSMAITNMHTDADDFLALAFCEIIPEATHVCDHLKSQTPSMKKNGSSSKAQGIYIDRIAMAAYERGWIDGKKYKRYMVQEAIETHAEKLGLHS